MKTHMEELRARMELFKSLAEWAQIVVDSADQTIVGANVYVDRASLCSLKNRLLLLKMAERDRENH